MLFWLLPEMLMNLASHLVFYSRPNVRLLHHWCRRAEEARRMVQLTLRCLKTQKQEMEKVQFILGYGSEIWLTVADLLAASVFRFQSVL